MDARKFVSTEQGDPCIITLTTDFGSSDTYVGVMKGVILGINPNARIVDLTHAIAPQAIQEAAFSIHGAYPYFPKGSIHVIVVDPGVGTERRAVICESGGTFFVCPDNGVLSHVLREDAGEAVAVDIQNRAYCLPEISHTFHGRDIFAPVAAHLSLGVPPAEFGPPARTLHQLPMLSPKRSANGLTGEIIAVDRFGNAITNISERDLGTLKNRSTRETGAYAVSVKGFRLDRLNRTYAESAHGDVLALIGSTGWLEIAINGGDAAATLALSKGERVVVRTLGEQEKTE